MFYVSYDKPAKIPDAMMDRAVAFASEFLEIEGEMEVLFDGEFDNGCFGYVEYDPEDLALCVYVDGKNQQDQFLTTFFHEMVHVRQHERGDLKDHGIRKAWKGEEYFGIYDSKETYMNLPWEEEAYRLQEEIYEKWIKTSTTN